ncbi:TIGR01244 family sulfur transferase [Aquamicrobium terrae]|uniref:Uncharacterized protein (TIGR01244 family) n=1 Tax=Aquamicrobium terrae TaxID=1324945 RepID=A0ABV2N3V0_9HYPH
MEIRQISEDYSVTGQIALEDVAQIKAAGIKSVICNRPDGEQVDQPTQDAVRAAVEAAGLTFRYIPVVSGQMTADNVADQAKALEELPAPILAYCRSGTRCTNLFLAIQQSKA